VVRRSNTGEVVVPVAVAVLDTRSVGGAIENAVAALVGVVGNGDTVDTVAVKDAGEVLAAGVATVVEGLGAIALQALVHLRVRAVADTARVLVGGGVAAVGNAVTAGIGEVG
jgi:hypothetical protein